MSYAILITGETAEAGTLKQIIIASHNNNHYAWSRKTSGGRGTDNAWFDVAYSEVITQEATNKNTIIGEILSSPLTATDITAIETGERPTVLIQKLTKQFGLRHKNASNKTIGDVVVEVVGLIAQDPALLDKYRSDGRKDKGATLNTNTNAVAPTNFGARDVVVAPVIQVVREAVAPTDEIIGNYVIRIPSANDVGHYIPRVIDGVNENAFWDYAISEGQNVLIEGPAGTGKSTSPEYDSYLRNQGCAVVGCSVGLEVSHLLGKAIIDPNAGLPTWTDGILVQAMKNGDKIIFNEVDFAHPKVLQRIQDVAQQRKVTLIENGGEVVVAHPNFSLVCTYNNGYRHSNKLNEAFLDRFIKLRFDYNHEIEAQLIKSPTLLVLANQMRADSINGTYSTPISLRILSRFQDQVRKLSYEFGANAFILNFTDEERPSVKLLLEAHRDKLETELTTNK